jgi:hypothetical protein
MTMLRANDCADLQKLENKSVTCWGIMLYTGRRESGEVLLGGGKGIAGSDSSCVSSIL